MKTFKEFLDENFIDEEEVDEAIPRKAKHDKSPEARKKRREAKLKRKKNRGKIRQQRKKRALKMKTPAYKRAKERADDRGRTMGGDRKTTYTNKT